MKIGVIPQRHQASLEKGKTASWNQPVCCYLCFCLLIQCDLLISYSCSAVLHIQVPAKVTTTQNKEQQFNLEHILQR